MQHITLLVVAVGFSITTLVPASWAGVVMSETSVDTSPAGARTVNRTIYVQGNKQKVEKAEVDSITDLDKGVVYIVDKLHKRYLEMPISRSVPDEMGSGDSQGETINLDNTHGTRVVAKQTCTEYRGGHTNEVERIAVSACVSRSAPGTSEVIAFDEKFSRAVGSEDQGPQNGTAGLVLEQRSTVSFRVPDPTRGDAYRVASFASKTEIREIRLRPLPEATFAPPESFSRVTSAPAAPTPRPAPHAPDKDEYRV
ncbi:MAG: hypothetical protein JO121_14580 [Deltaproteobacteria bacterium]|nr:hypothetical protein [Deltaproteobacteria bacterium]